MPRDNGANSKIRPIIKSDLFDAYQRLLSVLPNNKDTYLPLYHCKVSTLLKFEFVKKNVDEDFSRKQFFRSTVDIAISCVRVGRGARKYPLLAIDIGPKQTPEVETKQKLFAKSGVRYVHLNDIRTDWDRIDWPDLINGASQRGHRNSHFNDAESRFYMELNRVLAKHNAVYLAEVGLTSVMELSDDDKMRVTDFVKYNKANNNEARISLRVYDTLNFDGIVATAPPYSLPIFAVELDGGIHNDDEDKKVKDKIKNDLCLRNRLPLIRVSLPESADYDLLMEYCKLLTAELAIKMLMSSYHYELLKECLQAEKSRIEGLYLRDDLGRVIDHTTEYYEKHLSRSLEKLAHLEMSNRDLKNRLSLVNDLGSGKYEDEHLREIHEHDMHKIFDGDAVYWYDFKYSWRDRDYLAITLQCTPKKEGFPDIGLRCHKFHSDTLKVKVYAENEYKNLAKTVYADLMIPRLERKSVLEINRNLAAPRQLYQQLLARARIEKLKANVLSSDTIERKLDAIRRFIGIQGNPIVREWSFASADELLADKIRSIRQNNTIANGILRGDPSCTPDIYSIIEDDLNAEVERWLSELKIVSRDEYLRLMEERSKW